MSSLHPHRSHRGVQTSCLGELETFADFPPQPLIEPQVQGGRLCRLEHCCKVFVFLSRWYGIFVSRKIHFSNCRSVNVETVSQLLTLRSCVLINGIANHCAERDDV